MGNKILRINPISIVLLNIIFVLIFSACSSKPKITESKPDRVKTALIKTKLTNIRLNDDSPSQNYSSKIPIGSNVITYDGLTVFKISKEPLIDVGKEKTAAASVGACVMALPLCPLSLLFINMAVGTTTSIESKCSGNIIFDARESEVYFIKLIEIEKSYPELRVLNKKDVVVAKTILECVIKS